MRIHLSAGYIIKNKENRTYSITKKMGEGATCIAYYGVDEQTKAKCVIKEYYPINVSIERTDDGWLVCAVAEIDKFNRGKERFNSSIERQINLRNIGNATNQIFYVLDCFDANGNYLGGIYSFKLNGTTYYTTFEDLQESYAKGIGNNNIDGQPKLAYYNATYVSTKVEETEKALTGYYSLLISPKAPRSKGEIGFLRIICNKSKEEKQQEMDILLKRKKI